MERILAAPLAVADADDDVGWTASVLTSIRPEPGKGAPGRSEPEDRALPRRPERDGSLGR